jgi:hypothetical protein
MNTAKHNNAVYDFNYESWVKKSDDGKSFVFGRCVQTNNDKDLYVDWKKTNLSGFALPNSPCNSQITSPTSDEMAVQTDLLFGVAKEKIVVSYKEVKDKDAYNIEPLISKIKMYVPSVAGKATELRKVDAEFVARVEKKGDNFKYTYSWGPAAGKGKGKEKQLVDHEQIRFRWVSDSVQKAMKDSGHKDAPASVFKERENVSLMSASEPAYAVTVIEFLDRAGKEVVGTCPAAVYYPKQSKK